MQNICPKRLKNVRFLHLHCLFADAHCYTFKLCILRSLTKQTRLVWDEQVKFCHLCPTLVGMSEKRRSNWAHCCVALLGHKTRPNPLLNNILEIFWLFKMTIHWHWRSALYIIDILKGCVHASFRSMIITNMAWWRTRTDSLHPSQGAGTAGSPSSHPCSRCNLHLVVVKRKISP